jgi:hypothetical protein
VATSRGERRTLVAVASVAALAAAFVLAVALLPGSSPQPGGPTGGVAGQVASPVAKTAEPSATGSSSVPALPSESPAVTPTAEPRVVVTYAVVSSWAGSGATEAHVVVGVANDGGTLIQLDPAATEYEVRDAGGGPVAAGRFTYPMPLTIEPGETGWFVESMTAMFVKPDPGWTVHVEPRFREAERPARRYTVDDVAWSIGPDGRLTATGRVTNETGAQASQPIVATIFLDSNGVPLAGLYDLTDAALLDAGKTQRFETDYPGSPPVEPARIARLEAFAYEADE